MDSPYFWTAIMNIQIDKKLPDNHIQTRTQSSTSNDCSSYVGWFKIQKFTRSCQQPLDRGA